MSLAEVVLPLPLYQTFTYRVTAPVSVGSRVLVPLGRKRIVGLVSELHERHSPHRLKNIETVLDFQPLLPPNYLMWLSWAATYYLAPLGEALAAALPAPFFKPHSLEKLLQTKPRQAALPAKQTRAAVLELNAHQQKALEGLHSLAASAQFAPALLQGITGSGKTEVYLRLAQSLVGQKKQVLILVPEIALTPQTVARFQSGFGEGLGVFHSGLTPAQRLVEWLKALDGRTRVMIGTRSALFAPFSNLGAIIIDEEHDSSYKQEEGFRYQARDLALVRGREEKAIVLLGSATPSLESWQNARNGKFHYFQLPERAGAATPPRLTLVDMAAYRRQSGSPLVLCRELHEAIEENLHKREQTLLLLNRRGFARSCLCLACESAVTCINCSLGLIYHRREKALRCHYCDHQMALPPQCPTCGAAELTLLGDGTQSLEDEIKSFHPQAVVARLDRDSLSKKGSLLKILGDLRKGKIDILIGTQMLAKGHDIPNVTLVGVAGIDASLGLPDFRAAERAFQLLVQVSGRAGRGEKPGRVIVQSYRPTDESLRLACEANFEEFCKREIERRRELHYPPAGRMIRFIFSSVHEKKLEALTRLLGPILEKMLETPGLSVLGPVPATLEKIRGRFRWHLILKGRGVSVLHAQAQNLVRFLIENAPTQTKWAVDVDPLDML